MATEIGFKMGPFLVGLGLISYSVFTFVFIEKISDWFYRKSFFKNFVWPGDKPEYMVAKAKVAGIIVGCGGIIQIISVLKDYFYNS